MEFAHAAVLEKEAVGLLNCRPGGVYVDGTVGGGGHAEAILRASSPDARLIGIDRDSDALRAAENRLRSFAGRVTFVKENLSAVKSVLAGLGIESVDGIIYDLGVSSFQLDSPGRGFSFRRDEPLDMRMDREAGETARGLVNRLSAEELRRIFKDLGEERFAGRIASAIAQAREAAPIETTGELARIVSASVPKRFHPRDIHPATRVFQALRIAVNDELGSLDRGLKDGIEVLRPGGRMAVISFHSLEDRIVKTVFNELSRGCVCPPRIPRCVCGRTPSVKVVTKKPVAPSAQEVERNPRSRSAKLRAAERI